MSCGVGCRRGSDPALLWLWRRPVATAPIGPLAWEPPYAAGAALEMAKNTHTQNINSRSSHRGTMVNESRFDCGFDPWPRSVDWGSNVAVSYGVGRRHGSDLALLWLWHRQAATGLIRPLAWEPPYAVGSSPRKIQKKKKKRKIKMKQQKVQKDKDQATVI